MNTMLSTTVVALGLLGAGALAQGAMGSGAKEKEREQPKRVKAGDAAPDFSVKPTEGKERTLADLRGEKKDKIVVVSFWSHTCPWSRAWDAELSKIAKDYSTKNVVVVAIDSNDAKHSDGKNSDTADDVARYRKEKALAFEVFLDPTHRIADMFGGQTTPDVFVIGVDGKVRYTGAVNDMSNPSAPDKFEKSYLRSALDAMIAGKPVADADVKPTGCGIKRAKIGS